MTAATLVALMVLVFLGSPRSMLIVIADVAFLIYGFWNGWDIPGSTISAWLGAVVVQVIAVGLVIARSLFPPDKRAA